MKTIGKITNKRELNLRNRRIRFANDKTTAATRRSRSSSRQRAPPIDSDVRRVQNRTRNRVLNLPASTNINLSSNELDTEEEEEPIENRFRVAGSLTSFIVASTIIRSLLSERLILSTGLAQSVSQQVSYLPQGSDLESRHQFLAKNMPLRKSVKDSPIRKALVVEYSLPKECLVYWIGKTSKVIAVKITVKDTDGKQAQINGILDSGAWTTAGS